MELLNLLKEVAGDSKTEKQLMEYVKMYSPTYHSGSKGEELLVSEMNHVHLFNAIRYLDRRVDILTDYSIDHYSELTPSELLTLHMMGEKARRTLMKYKSEEVLQVELEKYKESLMKGVNAKLKVKAKELGL